MVQEKESDIGSILSEGILSAHNMLEFTNKTSNVHGYKAYMDKHENLRLRYQASETVAGGWVSPDDSYAKLIQSYLDHLHNSAGFHSIKYPIEISAIPVDYFTRFDSRYHRKAEGRLLSFPEKAS